MSDYSPKVMKQASPWWSSLPEAVAISCLAQLSRLDLARFGMASKSHRSLLSSPELYLTRSLMGCTEETLYMCLRICPDPSPRWFIFKSGWLSPIPSNPHQAKGSSSLVVVDSGIYVIGGILNDGNPTSDVWFLECISHIWHQVPSMNMPRASASASFVDGKIYVFGGCGDSANWAEVFDTKTQTWDHFITPKMDHDIKQSAVIENKKVFAVDDQGKNFCFSPSESSLWTPVIIQHPNYEPRYILNRCADWCAGGILLFCFDSLHGKILWCRDVPELLFKWDVVIFSAMKFLKPKPVLRNNKYGKPRLCINSRWRLFIFSNLQPEGTESLELWCTEIKLRKRTDMTLEIPKHVLRGSVMSSNVIFKIDHVSDSPGIEVLHSAFVKV